MDLVGVVRTAEVGVGEQDRAHAATS
jgi:hypothetical protein